MAPEETPSTEIVKKSPRALEPAPDFAGHLIEFKKSNSTKVIFCKRFYTVNGFLCLEDVKREKHLESNEERINVLSHHQGVDYKPTQKNNSKFTIDYKYSSRFQAPYYESCPMRTMPTAFMMDSWSFQDEGEAPEWIKYNKQEAQVMANSRARKDCDDKRIYNREYLFDKVIPNYWIHIAQKAYFESWWRCFVYRHSKKLDGFNKWVEEYMEAHPHCDLTPLKEKIEKCKIEFDQEIDWTAAENDVPDKNQEA